MNLRNLLHYRWRRKIGVYERVIVLLCLKVPLDHVEEERDAILKREEDILLEAAFKEAEAALLRTTFDNFEENLRREDCETRTLKGNKAREKLPKEIWRVILEYL